MERTFVEILNNDGTVFFRGMARSRADAVQQKLSEVRSLAGVDLSGIHFRGISLDGVDLSNANLSNADLRGSTAREATFDGANLTGVFAGGLQAERASFKGIRIDKPEAYDTIIGRAKRRQEEGEEIDWIKVKADARRATEPAILANANLTGASFQSAKIENAFFDGAELYGTYLNGATIIETKFRNAKLQNAIHDHTTYRRCDFSAAHVEEDRNYPVASHDNVARRDRTRGTRALGCKFDGAITDNTTPIFSNDKIISLEVNLVSTALASTAILTAGKMAKAATGITLDTAWFGHNFGPHAADMLILTGISIPLLLTKAVPTAARFLGQYVSAELGDKLRPVVDQFARKVGSLMDVGIAITPSAKSFKMFKQALSAAAAEGDHEASAAMKTLVSNNTFCIVTTRRNMIAALEWLASGYGRGELTQNIVLQRPGAGNDVAPTFLTFLADGGMAAVWKKAGREDQVHAWSAAEIAAATLLPHDRDFASLAAENTSKPHPDIVRMAFEEAILSEHRSGHGIEFDSKKHQIEFHGENSFSITDKETGEVHEGTLRSDEWWGDWEIRSRPAAYRV